MWYSFVIINLFCLFGKDVDVLVIMWFSYVFIINKYLSSTLIRKLSRSGRTYESQGIVLVAFGEIKKLLYMKA